MAVAAKRGDLASARTLAKEIVHTKKVREDGAAVVALGVRLATWRQSGGSAHPCPGGSAQQGAATRLCTLPELATEGVPRRGPE